MGMMVLYFIQGEVKTCCIAAGHIVRVKVAGNSCRCNLKNILEMGDGFKIEIVGVITSYSIHYTKLYELR